MEHGFWRALQGFFDGFKVAVPEKKFVSGGLGRSCKYIVAITAHTHAPPAALGDDTNSATKDRSALE
jgi:hypothetical protein